MGHIVSTNREHHLLQQKLDSFAEGAPASPVFMKILELLFTPEEANLASKLPYSPTHINTIASRIGKPSTELIDKFVDLASRGLVIDIEHKGERYFALSPVIIGFFEFTFMRTRDEIPMAELAGYFEDYLNTDDLFSRSLFQGETQRFRSFVNENALPDEDHIEILDWERSSEIIKQAKSIGIGLCSCRHKASHLGKACDAPQLTCMTFDYAADMLLRSGIAQPIEASQALKILEDCRSKGLAQTGDNVQKKVTYICNCCGCCCHVMRAIKSFDLRNAIVTSNWIMEIDLEKCNGCAKCESACPVGAISIKEEKTPEGKRRRWAVRDADLCLGCGACYASCKFDAIGMKPRERRVYTPETMFDRVVMMAIERGKLSNLILENPETISHRALGRMIGVLEKTAAGKALMATKPMKSTFLNNIIKQAKKQSGVLGEIMT
jgi:ferredoxin